LLRKKSYRFCFRVEKGCLAAGLDVIGEKLGVSAEDGYAIASIFVIWGAQ
jgi:hypothetical protein